MTSYYAMAAKLWKREQYSPVPHSDNGDRKPYADEKERLFDDSSPIPLDQWRRSNSRSRAASFIISACLALVVYTVAILYSSSIWWKERMLHGPRVIDTPMRPWMRYEPQNWEHHHYAKDYSLVGLPSDEMDARWNDMMQTFYTEVPAEYMRKIGREDEGVRLPNGNYAATYSVMHEIHCIKRLWQGYFPERYLPNMTEQEQRRQSEHNLHCLNMLLNSVMCKPDAVPLTTMWLDNQPLPSGNTDVEHECVNWELFREGMMQHVVNPFEPGIFMHPFFGQAGEGHDRIQYGEVGEYGEVLHRRPDGSWGIKAESE